MRQLRGRGELLAERELKLFTVPECAWLLNLSEHCTWRLIRSRRLQSVKVRNRVLVSYKAIRRFIKKNSSEIGSPQWSPCDIEFDAAEEEDGRVKNLEQDKKLSR
ncbi:MAG: helix-turn-helix domain-containing protein [Cyanobacteria bacterium HKST-UBA02]|nr:helix-turn-helix domain-containing protein [Cyanobacteria bacterium HKST-UBA02]